MKNYLKQSNHTLINTTKNETKGDLSMGAFSTATTGKITLELSKKKKK